MPSAISYHIHFRALEDICRLNETFGAESVPILVEKMPAPSLHAVVGF